MVDLRQVGEEARKSQALRLETGFINAYLSGPSVLDIGYRGYIEDVVPIVPQAIGVELDYPGYDGRTLPFADLSQDAVFASHCLEHIEDFAQSLSDWFRVLRVGGFLVIMVPHQFLYEKRIALPSRFNADHKRYYTPGSLMMDIESVLPPNSYRLRHLADNDRHFDYSIPPSEHSGGCYEIELVIEKISSPAWRLTSVIEKAAARTTDFDALQVASDVDAMRPHLGGMPKIDILPVQPWNLALYDFGQIARPRRRILAMQLGHLGDFIIGLPALRDLRRCFPGDHVRLVVGTWNRGAALDCDLADEVLTHNYFPEVARNWDGTPVQTVETFAETVAGRYDIAIDMRVDEDTRHLLKHVEATTKCGIGAAIRFPWLDIVLPSDHSQRSTEHLGRSVNILLGPERFHSRMPVRSSFRHETDFRATNQHVIYGPYINLPPGRFRATFGLQLSGFRFSLRPTVITVDVTRDGGEVLVERELSPHDIAASISDTAKLDFTSIDDGASYEFRVHLRGRPLRARLAFSGVRLDQVEMPASARLRPADMHIGEQLSLLVRLVADRTSPLYAPAIAPPAAKGPCKIVIAPVSNSDLRDWPIEHYVTLVRLLVQRLDCTVQLIGSRAQSAALTHVVQASGAGDRAVSLGGRTAWADIPDILRAADLVICNNSGIAHLAASIGARTLAIYSASHQPQEWGPRGAQSRALMANIPCSPCGYDNLSSCPNDHACMQGLLPESVFAQVAAWLGGA